MVARGRQNFWPRDRRVSTAPRPTMHLACTQGSSRRGRGRHSATLFPSLPPFPAGRQARRCARAAGCWRSRPRSMAPPSPSRYTRHQSASPSQWKCVSWYAMWYQRYGTWPRGYILSVLSLYWIARGGMSESPAIRWQQTQRLRLTRANKVLMILSNCRPRIRIWTTSRGRTIGAVAASDRTHRRPHLMLADGTARSYPLHLPNHPGALPCAARVARRPLRGAGRVVSPDRPPRHGSWRSGRCSGPPPRRATPRRAPPPRPYR